MSVKDDFLQALDDDFPDSLKNSFGITFPAVGGVVWPTTVEEAIIVQGQVACNLNEVMGALAGLPVVEMFMYLGQKNRTSHAMLLSALEFIASQT